MLVFIRNLFALFKWDMHRIFKEPEYDFSKKKDLNYWESRGTDANKKLNIFQYGRLNIFRNCVTAPARIFDVGSGTGETISWLAEEGYNVTASDFNYSLTENYKRLGIQFQHLDAIDFVNSDLSKYSIEYFTFFEVLEHLVNAEEVLSHAFSLCESGVIFTIPNSTHYSYILRMLFRGRAPCQWRVHPAEHLRFWGLCEVKDWVNGVLGENIELKVIPYVKSPLIGSLFPHLFSRGIFVLILKRKGMST